LNKANIQLLTVSLEKLKIPKPGYESSGSEDIDEIQNESQQESKKDLHL